MKQLYRERLLLLLLTTVLFIFFTGCGPSADDLASVDYKPIEREDWEISTPEDEGIDPELVAEVYYNASKLDTIYSLLVVKTGKLIGEKYFNNGSIDELGKRASVTKSYTSALTGIALEQGYLENKNQKMLEFFPDISDQVTDPRKWAITIENMLEMKSGYPWEEEDATAWEAMWSGEYLSQIAAIPLISDPGTRFKYSNLTAHWLGIIVARAAGKDLKTFGEEYLFDPLGVTPGEGWIRDLDGYYIASGDIIFSARDMAKFGQLYLDGGKYNDQQLISAEWVYDSLKTYSVNEFEVTSVGKFKNMGYGYMWWSAEVGNHHVNFAWGHGGQLIVLEDSLDLVVVTTADPFYGPDTHQNAWPNEKAILETISTFIYSLPSE
jgi:CubicO group peptidase (beta-lactamase class C family)